jgi:hypothetical protein
MVTDSEGMFQDTKDGFRVQVPEAGYNNSPRH